MIFRAKRPYLTGAEKFHVAKRMCRPDRQRASIAYIYICTYAAHMSPTLWQQCNKPGSHARSNLEYGKHVADPMRCTGATTGLGLAGNEQHAACLSSWPQMRRMCVDVLAQGAHCGAMALKNCCCCTPLLLKAVGSCKRTAFVFVIIASGKSRFVHRDVSPQYNNFLPPLEMRTS